jgi:GAF domain-containing protein
VVGGNIAGYTRTMTTSILTVSGLCTLGTLCAVDVVPRCWTPEEMEILTELSALVTMLIEMRKLLSEQGLS